MACAFGSYLKRLHIKTDLIGCVRDVVEFNPMQEKDVLLKQWLLFRGVHFTENSDLRLLASEEIRNFGKPLTAFSAFDPSVASIAFLRAWLSCFGITGDATDHAWWVKRARALLTLLNKLSSRESRLEKYERFLALRRKKQRWVRWMTDLNDVFDTFSTQDFIRINGSQKDRTIDATTHKKTTESTFVKQLLAAALDASAISVPLLLYQVQESKPKLKPTDGYKEAIKHEIPGLVAKTFLFLSHSDADTVDAAIADIDSNRAIPVNVSKKIAKRYLSNHPNAFRVLSGFLLPSVLNVFNRPKQKPASEEA
jgi:hypothetical protein